MELGIDAYIPRSYVPSSRQRMEVYRRLSACGSGEDLAQLSADLADAYGQVPPIVQTMLDVAEIRVLAGHMGIDSIIRMDPDIIFAVRDLSGTSSLLDGAAGSVRMPDQRTVHWRPPDSYRQMPTLVNVLLKRFRAAGCKV